MTADSAHDSTQRTDRLLIACGPARGPCCTRAQQREQVAVDHGDAWTGDGDAAQAEAVRLGTAESLFLRWKLWDGPAAAADRIGIPRILGAEAEDLPGQIASARAAPCLVLRGEVRKHQPPGYPGVDLRMDPVPPCAAAAKDLSGGPRLHGVAPAVASRCSHVAGPIAFVLRAAASIHAAAGCGRPGADRWSRIGSVSSPCSPHHGDRPVSPWRAPLRHRPRSHRGTALAEHAAFSSSEDWRDPVSYAV